MAHPINEWAKQIPESEWALYDEVLTAAEAEKIPFALGGAFAVATYTGCWRNTKDLDLYVPPEHKDRMIGLVTRLGMVDYFETKDYDRWWIYRATTNGSIVDIIWAMANHRQQIDELWMSGPTVNLRGHEVRVLPVEAMLWDKVYIMQRERCDWPDVFNLLYAAGADADWKMLLGRIGEDTPLIAGVLSVFRWLAPDRAELLPSWIWQHVGLPPLKSTPGRRPVEDFNKRRVDLLDRRVWFAPERARLEPAA